MTSAVSAVDLDDADGLLAADHDGMLRATASAGALIRATAAAVEEGALDGLAGRTVRSVVLVAGPGPARSAAHLVAALVAGRATVPVSAVPVVPRWLGPLDVLVVLSDDPGDLDLAESVARVERRGTGVVFGAPDEGPLAAAGGSRALRMPARVLLPPSASLPRFVAVALAALGAAGVVEGTDLGALADALDVAAAHDHPSQEVFASPAKSLAARMTGRPLVLAGAGPATEVVARFATACLLRDAGTTATAVGLSDALAAEVARADTGSVDALFHDPELDGPGGDAGVRVLVLATDAEREQAQRRALALGDPHLVTAAEPDTPLPGGEVTEVMALAARLHTAAVYLGLVR